MIGAGISVTGTRKRFSRRVEGTRQSAEKALRDWLAEFERGEVVRPTPTTLNAYFDSEWESIQKTRLRPSTIESTQRFFNTYLRPRFGNTALTSLEASAIQTHLSDLIVSGGRSGKPLAASTVLKVHHLLNSILDSAVDHGLIGRNPASRIAKPRPQRHEIRVLQPWQVTALLELMNERYSWAEPATRLAFFTGLRRGEVLGLKWDDVDLVSSRIAVRRTYHRMDELTSSTTPPKTLRSNRSVALTASTVEWLLEHRHQAEDRKRLLGTVLRGEHYIFEWSDGEPARPDSLSQALRRTARELGFTGFRFQDTRHTHASLMLKAGVHPKIVSERLGHSSIAFTLDTYSHVLPGLQEAAAVSFESMMTNGKERKQADDRLERIDNRKYALASE